MIMCNSQIVSTKCENVALLDANRPESRLHMAFETLPGAIYRAGRVHYVCRPRLASVLKH